MSPNIDVVRTVVHPLVSSMYLKRDLSNSSHENILVIETNFARQDEAEDTSDSYLIDLLIDLQDLKTQAEREVGAVDRIDIRQH